MRYEAGADRQLHDLRNQNADLRSALSGAQTLQHNTNAKVDQLRLQLAEAQLMGESRAAEINNLREQVMALSRQLAERASANSGLSNRLQAADQQKDLSRFETERSLRDEIERLMHEAQEKSQILQNRNDELVTVKAAMDALRERLRETETTAAAKENTAAAELERMRVEFQAELAFFQAELSQKDWALQEREAMSQSVEQRYRDEIDSLQRRLEENKPHDTGANEEFTIGETQSGQAPDLQFTAEAHDNRNGLESSAQRRRWHTGFAWKRRWKASEAK
jgi:chromosome segregation ATPase